MHDVTRIGEHTTIGASVQPHQPITWRARWQVHKYAAGADDVRAGRYVSSTNPPERLGLPVEPYETVDREGNLLVYGGADVLWLGLKGGLTASTGAANTYFNNGNAAIAVGDSNTAAAATQTDLQASSASTDRAVVGMEATYPTHTTGTGSTASQNIVFRSVFSTDDANFAWNEWGIKNKVSSTAGAGRLLNRKVESLGTKTAAASWTFTCTLSLS